MDVGLVGARTVARRDRRRSSPPGAPNGHRACSVPGDVERFNGHWSCSVPLGAYHAAMQIVFASSEVAPFCRTGGLGDVLGALPGALAATGEAKVATFLPLHRAARLQLDRSGRELRDTECTLAVPLQGRASPARIRELVDEGPLRTFFVDAPRFFDRGGLYGHGDDLLRYAFFSRATLLAAGALLGPPDIVHAHDWMTSLLPTYLRHRRRDRLPTTRSVLTIHNLAYQGPSRRTRSRPSTWTGACSTAATWSSTAAST